MAILELNALSVDLSGSFSATVLFPENASLTECKKYPALFFVHDIGGDDTDIRAVKGLDRLANQYGIFIVAPSVMHSFGLDLPWGAKYGHFLWSELPKICAHLFPLDTARLSVGGVGWGAYGAAYQCAHHPDIFARCAAIDGRFDVAGLCRDCLAGKEIPYLRRPNLEALFAPLEAVTGSDFDLLSGTQPLPREIYLGCTDTDADASIRMAKVARCDVHTAFAEYDLYKGALRWLCR